MLGFFFLITRQPPKTTLFPKETINQKIKKKKLKKKTNTKKKQKKIKNFLQWKY